MFARACTFIRLSLIISFTLVLSALSSVPALADGLIIPDPPPLPDPVSLEESWLSVRYHRVSVSIEGQIAVTHVEQEFVNQQDWEVEGTYIFPIPDGATISKFVMWVDGVPLESEILPADQARKIYEDIVRERQDPALLEYTGSDAVRARIFPIPTGGSRVIELEYTQVLEMDQGLVRYLYPLNTEKFSAQPLEECSLRIELDSFQPLRTIYSPTHQDRIEIYRENDHQALVGYEEENVLPEEDFELIYSVGQEDIGLNLLTYPDTPSGTLRQQSGYFLLLVSPSLKVDQVVPRDIILVLDTSGSMEGGKLEQAKGAAAYVLEHLNQEDRFNVIAFSTAVKSFSYQLQPASQAPQALAWIDDMEALGGTNINQALLQALTLDGEEKESSRPRVLLFLTDGLPTEGVTDIDQILSNVRSTAGASLRLFSFGVGYDVNTELLDTLADENRGLVSYVRPEERVDEEVSGLFAKIQTPVLADLELDFGEVMVEELYPPQLPDLFAGSQLLLVGRYRLPPESTGRTEIRLTGELASRQKSFRYLADFDPDWERSGGASFIPRLWAARKIGYLLNQIRHQGENQEWVEAVIQLSRQYGIITPYTSFLIREENLFTEEGRDEAARELSQNYAGSPAGAEAVQKADAESELREAASVPEIQTGAWAGETPSQEAAVRYLDGKSFFYQGGIWMDSSYDPVKMEPIQIGFGTEPYFALLEARPDWGKYLALGEEVIFVGEGTAYQITSGGGGISALPEELMPEDFNEWVGAHPVGSHKQAAWRTLCPGPLLMGLVCLGLGKTGVG